MKKGLYFIAILPPDLIAEVVQSVKKEFVEKYDSEEAFGKPPHFTLQIPFKLLQEREKIIIEKLTSFAKTQEAFTLKLSGFNHFRDDVIFVDVENASEMKMLHRNLINFLQDELGFTDKMVRNKSLTPHMTVAYRDLTAENFQKAWKEFQDRPFNYSFEVNNIFLLKHDYKQWQPHYEFSFGNN